MLAADYYSPVWMNSAHVKKTDSQINSALRTVTRAVDPMEVKWLYILSDAAPPYICRQEADLFEF